MHKFFLGPFSFIIAAASAQSYTSLPAVHAGGLYLVESIKAHEKAGLYPCDTAAYGCERLLERARKRGFRYAVCGVPVKVSSCIAAYDTASGTVDTAYGFFFYPEALDWNTKRPLRYYREMFRKCDSLGMILIPMISFPGSNGGWQDLHPPLRDTAYPDSIHPAPDIVLNNYGDVHTAPFADTSPDGFYTHLRELLQRIKIEYDEFYGDTGCHRTRVHPKTLPYVYFYEDENYALSRAPFLLRPRSAPPRKPYFFPPPHHDTHYPHLVLMLGQNNPYDRGFCDGVLSCGRTFQEAVRRLYAYALWKRAALVREVFHDSLDPAATTQMITGGQMFDPWFGGSVPYQTYHANTRDPNGYDHVRLAPNDGVASDVLDLPGLDASQQALVRQCVILAPWHYSADKWEGGGSEGPPYPGDYDTAVFSWRYDYSMTYRYFKSKGFRFAPLHALAVDRGDTMATASFFDGLRNSMEAVMSPGFDGYAVGYQVAWWPCGNEDSAHCPSRVPACTEPCACRCGRASFNGYWDNSPARDDASGQPLEYRVMEYAANFADNTWPPLVEVKTAPQPASGKRSMIRALCPSIKSGLDRMRPGDTIEVWKGAVRLR